MSGVNIGIKLSATWLLLHKHTVDIGDVGFSIVDVPAEEDSQVALRMRLRRNLIKSVPIYYIFLSAVFLTSPPLLQLFCLNREGRLHCSGSGRQ